MEAAMAAMGPEHPTTTPSRERVGEEPREPGAPRPLDAPAEPQALEGSGAMADVEAGARGEPAAASRRPRRAPKAKSDRRERRITIYATPVQEELLREQAKAAGRPLSSYLIARGLQSQVVARSDWHRVVERLTVVERRLEGLARQVEDQAEPLDALRIATALLAIERAVRGLAMPWQRAIAEAADLLASDASRPSEAGEGAVARARDDCEEALDK